MAPAGGAGDGSTDGTRRRSRRGEPEPAPLGSLSHPEQQHAPGSAECEACGSTRLTRLHLDLADGTAVTFVSCHECEHRAWFPVDGDGSSLTRDEIVARSTRR
ncbi:MAG TPA: hypothetical protein VGC67_14210 [Cellulomonas sp.]